MCTPRCFPTLLAFAATLPFLAGTARAQCDSAIQANRSDGTLWFQSLPPKRSAGSAQLASVDLGPAMPPNLVGGQQAVWLEWNRTHIYAGFLGGGLSSAEVLDDSTGVPLPMPDILGAATANGGFILTTSLVSGGLTDIRPCVGSFLWTPSQLFLVAIGGGIDVAEVTFAGAPIPDVQGVAVIDSQIFDYDPDPCVVAGHIVGSALAFTPSHVYLVDFDLSGGATSMTFEVLDPAGLPFAKTRGITVSSRPAAAARPAWRPPRSTSRT